MSRKLIILAEDCSDSKEAANIFIRRDWNSVDDQSIPLPGKKHVRKTSHDTSLIRLEIEEFEYGVDEERAKKKQQP